MKTKLVYVMCMTIGLFTNQLFAQNSPKGASKESKQQQLSPDERAQKETDMAEKKLGLTAEQKQKWETAAKTRLYNNSPLKEKMQGSTTPEERKTIREQIHANNQAFDSQVQSFLNEDQKLKFDSMKKEYQEKKRHRNAKHGTL